MFNGFFPAFTVTSIYNLGLTVEYYLWVKKCLISKYATRQHHMNDRECLRTSTNVWRSLCDHCELMANCIRKPIRHTFATGETSITFETPQKRPQMLTNSYECLAIICDHYKFMAMWFQWTNHVPWLFTSLIVNKFLRIRVVDNIQ